jgi:DNA-binding transcriptional regulator YiaG
LAMNDFPLDAQTFFIIRKVYRMSMMQMAETLGISTGYVNHIEKEREPLTDNVRRSLIRKLDLSPEKVSQIKAIYQTYSKQAL